MHNGRMISRKALLAYGALALPVACIALPIYIILPKFYADHYGLPLTVIGLVLLLSRLIDTIQDPLIGWWIDKRQMQPDQLRDSLLISGPLMGIGFVLLVHPFVETMTGRALWLGMMMVFTYFFFSIVTITHQSLATAITLDYREQTRISAVREALGLAGVLVGAALPTALAPYVGEATAYSLFSIMVVPVMLVAAFICSRYAPQAHTLPFTMDDDTFRESSARLLRNTPFLCLAGVFFLSSFAAAMPATMLMFFVEGVLRATQQSGYFLATYFLGGALGMPLWIWMASRIGKKLSWMAAMTLSILAFLYALLLQEGNVVEFYVVCLAAGLSLGADLALPVSMLADTLGGNPRSARHFGIWSFIGKLALALGGGLSLYLLGIAGYQHSTLGSQQSITALALIFALLPCVVKFLAMLLLWRGPLDRDARKQLA